MQESANAIGEQIRSLHAKCNAASPELSQEAGLLHNMLANAFVAHLEPLGLDWDQVAGGAPAPKGGPHTNAGVKTKPTVEGEA